jgi:hypothetical protein
MGIESRLNKLPLGLRDLTSSGLPDVGNVQLGLHRIAEGRSPRWTWRMETVRSRVHYLLPHCQFWSEQTSTDKPRRTRQMSDRHRLSNAGQYRDSIGKAGSRGTGLGLSTSSCCGPCERCRRNAQADLQPPCRSEEVYTMGGETNLSSEGRRPPDRRVGLRRGGQQRHEERRDLHTWS